MKKQPKQKPETTPFFKYYIFNFLSDLGAEIFDLAQSLWRLFTGAWYCDYCKKYHGRRVTKYEVVILVRIFEACSLGSEAYKNGEWKPITLGKGKDQAS